MLQEQPGIVDKILATDRLHRLPPGGRIRLRGAGYGPSRRISSLTGHARAVRKDLGRVQSSGLERIEHIVVLLLENRSFDHMLGYLSLERGRSDVDGLQPGMVNLHDGLRYPVHRLARTDLPDGRWDPDHSASAVDLQINGGAMDGFAASYAQTLAAQGAPDGDPGVVLGYFNDSDLPVFDHLAEQFCVCDRWFCSVPGATWPNRLYAITGNAARSRDDKKVPLYNKHSFVRHLDAAGVSWRWYSYGFATLRCADPEYALGHNEHFAYVQRVKLVLKTRGAQRLFLNEDASSFIEDAAFGRLPAVSWIDPNFSDFDTLGTPPNDDHAPADVQHGQQLVLLVYNALASGPRWDKTLLIVVYDEHGGFFDHVPPPENPPDDDPQIFARYGVRIPALVVSPWVPARSVAHTLFDHTTIVKTILNRFCPAELDQEHGASSARHWLRKGHPHYMGKRVAAAADLGKLLSLDAPRPAPDRSPLVTWFADAYATRARRVLEDPAGTLRREAGHSTTSLQAGLFNAKHGLRDKGHPEDHP
jgi:phospholipase C